RNFVLRVPQSDLMKIDFNSWGHSRALLLMQNTRRLLSDSNIKNLVNHLKGLIESIGDSKVRIFPIVRMVVNNINYGYQYLVPTHSGTPSKQILAFREYLPKLHAYFEIDLSDKKNLDDINMLTHIATLLLTPLSSANIRFELAFIMKAWDGTHEDGTMITAFNREGYLNKDEIFSLDISGVIEGYRRYAVDIHTQSHVLENKDWNKIFLYDVLLTSLGTDSDFLLYMRYLRTANTPFCRYIRKILFIPDPS
ncbi:MAG: hypothetical protein ACW980_23710, partial [Promethearchaeota archaeon]